MQLHDIAICLECCTKCPSTVERNCAGYWLMLQNPRARVWPLHGLMCSVAPVPGSCRRGALHYSTNIVSLGMCDNCG